MSKKSVPEINASSQADIAFLLLIFFLVAASMDTDSGIFRRLPPMPPEDVVVNPPKYAKRNILQVLVNKNDMLAVNGEVMDISMLKEKALEFILNPQNKPDLPTPPGMPGPEHRRSIVISTAIVAAIVLYLVFSMGGALTPGGKGPDTLATNEFVTAVKDGRVHDATYKTSDGSVSGTYWHDEKDAEADNEGALVRYTSVYVGTDSLAELMAAHPDVTYKIDTSDSAMLETILLSVVPTLPLRQRKAHPFR